MALWILSRDNLGEPVPEETFTQIYINTKINHNTSKLAQAEKVSTKTS